MRNTLKIKVVRHQRKCIICGEWFNLNTQEVMLIESGLIASLDVNICNDCADMAAEQYAEEYDYNAYYL